MSNKLVTFLVFALCSTFCWADICDDINELANSWNEVANFLDECEEDDEISDGELTRLEKYVTDLSEDTYGLADDLIEQGNRTETNLGTKMRKSMAKLAEEEDQDQLVKTLDQLVDILDKTTDYCEK